MDRGLYPEGVRVGQSDLKFTEDTRSFHILQRHRDNTTLGIVYGFSVVANGTLINIAPGYGYAPNGEFIELESSVNNLNLAEYTNGIRNFVIATYTETYDVAQPHETNGNTYPTEANRSVRISVLTELQYNSLPQNDSNLSNNDLDRSIIIAIVTANGTGVDLNSANIELPSNFTAGLTATISGSSINGVSTLRISPETNIGSGTLSYNSSTQQLTWVAPGDTTGTATGVSLGGVYDLISGSGVSLTVLVTAVQLPTTNVSTSVSISNIYNQNISRHTTTDIQHRSLIGSGIPTSKNPHGLTMDDLGIGESQTEVHQEIFHSNGIWKGSASTFLEANVNTGILPHELNITGPVTVDRLYLNGYTQNNLSSTIIRFADITEDAQILFDIYVNYGDQNISSLSKSERIRYGSTPPPQLSTVIQLRNISDLIPSGAATIMWDTSFGLNKIRFAAPGDSYGSNIARPVVDGVIRLFSNNPNYYIDVYVKASGDWPVIPTTVENLTISAVPSLDTRLKIASVLFSGSSTGFLGNGFNPANNPNLVCDQRLFGLLNNNNINDSVGKMSAVYSNGVVANNIEVPLVIGDLAEEAAHPDLVDKAVLHLNPRNDGTQAAIKLKDLNALPTGMPTGDSGYIVQVSGDLYFWNGTAWKQISILP